MITKAELVPSAKALALLLQEGGGARKEIESLKVRLIALKDEETKLLASGMVDHQPTLDAIHTARTKQELIPAAIEKQQTKIAGITAQLFAKIESVSSECRAILQSIEAGAQAEVAKLLQAVITDPEKAKEAADAIFWKTDFGKVLYQPMQQKNNLVLGGTPNLDSAAQYVQLAQSACEVESAWNARKAQ